MQSSLIFLFIKHDVSQWFGFVYKTGRVAMVQRQQLTNKQIKAQNKLEIPRLGYLVTADLGYNIPYGYEYPI